MPLAPRVGSLFGVFVVASASVAAAAPVDYGRDIKPLLKARCYACHGALKQEAGLRLDTVDRLARGGESGPAIERGASDKSRLIARITSTDGDERMPPEGEGEALLPAQVDLLRRWIAEGAIGPADEQAEADPREHWSFRPRIRPAVPSPANSAWPLDPLDAFVARGQEVVGVTPVAAAPRPTLARRAFLDLVGVPPTGDELRAIADDDSPDWYERLVDRLLADPRHGERWGRHWLDIWRYSDWWGLGDQLRNSQKHIWHWRDWVIEAIDRDRPYDEIVRLMLAADELAPSDWGDSRATGFLARNYFLFNRNQWMDETIEHVGKSFLGLTLNCSKCHDHKYDPIPQADFYRMRAIFEPYHVRVDVAPGEPDLGRDGIPRAFDGTLDVPTYRFVRGQESQPDKSQAIPPGVPQIVSWDRFEVAPVTLPPDAWQPERRPWVAEAARLTLQRQLASTESKLNAVRAKLAKAKQAAQEAAIAAAQNPAPGPTPAAVPTEPLVADKFSSIDTARWKKFGGEWQLVDGQLRQTQDGPQRSVLRWTGTPPRDIDLTFKFAILGGSQWRSVGVSLDSTQADPTRDGGAGESEHSIYVSAYGGGSKVQVAYHRDGQWHYPAEAMVARPIELNRAYALRVQARGDLFNVSLDGQPLVAWRSPLPRREGALQLTSYDALATFHEVRVERLAAETKLREPGQVQPVDPLLAARMAELEVTIAERNVAAARLDLSSLDQRIAASRAEWRGADAQGTPEHAALLDAAKQAAREAARAEREVAAARADGAVADAELKALQASADKREAAEKGVAAARDAAAKAHQAKLEPSEQFTRLSGAAWTPTRFLHSTKDDPTVTFGPTSSGRRAALARWITDPRHPLTARVAANHVWARHFGAALAPTVFDFGRGGVAPANPELLDWLASELVDHEWSLKRLQRRIATSAVYRLSSSVAGADAQVARDPDNRWWWRRVPQRVEAEVVRDSVLQLAGTLDLMRGGPPVAMGEQAASRRRSLYFFHSNNDRNLFLTTFDAPLVKECYRREQSIVPQQALALTNSALVLDAIEPIARRLADSLAPATTGGGGESGPGDESAFVRRVFWDILGIAASGDEVAASVEAMKAWRAGGASPERARANLVWALLNHNDFVTVR